MCSVFSKYLLPLGVNDANSKPSVVYDHLRIAYNQGARGIIENANMFALERGEINCDILYEIWRNKPLHDILIWVNKKITLQLGIADYRTLGVRMRIATGMLNKLTKEGLLSKDMNINIHENFINAINGELSLINTEDLPF